MSNETIIYKRGWKSRVKDAWDLKKLTNLDFRGLTDKKKIELCHKFEISYKELWGASMFRGTFGFKTYAELQVITDKGINEVVKEYGEPYYYWAMDYYVDDKDALDEDYAMTYTELIDSLERLIKKYHRVWFKIGGERHDGLEKSDNWDYYILEVCN